jgi:hypothetical protein
MEQGMNDELKAVRNLGAELGAAKAENEKLRKLLTTLRISLNLDDTEYGLSKQEKSSLAADIDAELSRQAEPVCQTMQRPKAECGCPDCGSSLIDWPTAEPTDTYTAVDMATAAAQGFRDGQASVEQAAAQGEQPSVFWVLFDATGPERFIKKDVSDGTLAFFDSEDEAQRAKRRHPGTDYKLVEYYRAPNAQTAPQGKFRMGDLVRKTSGSEWEGRICGTYYTALTQEGYAVESEAHAGSVQIYPAKALEAVE